MKKKNKIQERLKTFKAERDSTFEIVRENIEKQKYDNNYYRLRLSELEGRISELEWIKMQIQ